MKTGVQMPMASEEGYECPGDGVTSSSKLDAATAVATKDISHHPEKVFINLDLIFHSKVINCK